MKASDALIAVFIASISSSTLAAEYCFYESNQFSIGSYFIMVSKENKKAIFRCEYYKGENKYPQWVLQNYLDKNGNQTDKVENAAPFSVQIP